MGTITPFEKPGIRGFLHRPESAVNGDGVVLTQEAGGNAASPRTRRGFRLLHRLKQLASLALGAQPDVTASTFSLSVV